MIPAEGLQAGETQRTLPSRTTGTQGLGLPAHGCPNAVLRRSLVSAGTKRAPFPWPVNGWLRRSLASAWA